MKFHNGQRVCNSDEYITLLDTMSDHRALPEENRKALYKEIKQIILNNGNTYKDEIIFQLYMGKK
ncbi:MAG: hypothetical protein DBX47_06790 [Clostridiales bacterium]|nr:MAG: hypothetical protein DBX47_06790 [Clostridiales bacterium]